MSEPDEIGSIIAAATAGGSIPGAVAAAGRGPSVLGTWTAGRADTTPGAERPMTASTVFDLASLTKVVSTTTLVLALAASGALRLDDRVGRYLPAAPWDVTIRQLLSHTSGLPAIGKFYEWCSTRGTLLEALFATQLEAPPGSRVAYSDLGFMTLGEMVTSVTGSPLDVVFREMVGAPLGMADTCFLPADPPAFLPADPPAQQRLAHCPPAQQPLADCPPAQQPLAHYPPAQQPLAERFAATEVRDDGTAWTGIVHDENARVMGGVAGHAGLFAPVADLARFATWWASPSDSGPVPAALRREAETCQTAGLPGDGGIQGHRGLGWVKPGDRFDIVGGTWPASAVSHTGFTGTSIALDSASGAWLVLLTNRVHAGRNDSSAAAIKALRGAVHTAAARALFP